MLILLGKKQKTTNHPISIICITENNKIRNQNRNWIEFYLSQDIHNYTNLINGEDEKIIIVDNQKG